MPGRDPGVDAIFDSLDDGRGVVFAKLRGLIHAADPSIAEAVKWRKPSAPLGAAAFERDGIVCILVPLKGRIRLSFAEGASLADPRKLFNAQLHGVSRAIDFPVGAKIDGAGVKALVREAAKRRAGARSGAPAKKRAR